MAPGAYIMDRVVLVFQNIVFTHETLSRVNASTPTTSSISLSGASVAAAKQSFILCYPRPHALDLKVELPRHVTLEEIRSVEVCISSGWNDIISGELRMRSASAGLRLQTADAEVTSGSLEITGRPRPGTLALGKLSTESFARLRIPYALEQEQPDISVRLHRIASVSLLNVLQVKVEMDYTTKEGHFSYAIHSNVTIVLPLGVHVQDIFKENA